MKLGLMEPSAILLGSCLAIPGREHPATHRSCGILGDLGFGTCGLLGANAALTVDPAPGGTPRTGGTDPGPRNTTLDGQKSGQLSQQATDHVLPV